MFPSPVTATESIPYFRTVGNRRERQIGLHYGAMVDLKLKYHLDDPASTPLPNATVKLAIFDDPGGSTLAQDRATTDSDGVATVKLTAGAQEKSFRVRAQAPDAPDAM